MTTLVFSWCWCILSFTHAKEYYKPRGECDIGGQLASAFSYLHAKEYNKLRGKCDDTGGQLVLVHSLIYTCQEYNKLREMCNDIGGQLVLVHSLIYTCQRV